MSDLVLSNIRTIVPIVVGAIIGWLTAINVTVDESAIVGLTAFLTGVFQALYYLVARALEQKYPKLGVLLGSTKTPTYK